MPGNMDIDRIKAKVTQASALVTTEHTARELEELTGISQSALSQYLARLQ